MIKTIKVKKNLRLDERIKYLWDNEVEVEEEITEDTALVGFQEVFLDRELRELKVEIHAPLKRKSINDVLEEHYEKTECLQIYAKVNGKLQLIWEA